MRRYVLFDVDGTLIDAQASPIPETMGVLRLVRLLDFDVRFWSARGVDHARDVANELGLPDTPCYTKPDPVAEAPALALLGDPPALQLDDDPTQRVASWPFMLVKS